MRPVATLEKYWMRGALAVALLAWCGKASADRSVIKLPGDHPDYVFEAEPHALIAPFKGVKFGVGFRGTIEIVDNGFISSINNTVGIGFGLDWFPSDRVRVPVVMQWNFWLSENWSVFGEPGGALVFGRKHLEGEPVIYAGGRLHFTPKVALTMRVGFPTPSVGVSFFL
ncbi:MAG TPA: hypothetical protein VGJ84_07140 [Polyangiaceae bacterium]